MNDQDVMAVAMIFQDVLVFLNLLLIGWHLRETY